LINIFSTVKLLDQAVMQLMGKLFKPLSQLEHSTQSIIL